MRAVPFAVLLGWCCLLFGPAPAPSQGFPEPQLATLQPPGGQAGTTVEVTVGGTDLDDVTGLLVSLPGLKAERLPTAREIDRALSEALAFVTRRGVIVDGRPKIDVGDIVTVAALILKRDGKNHLASLSAVAERMAYRADHTQPSWMPSTRPIASAPCGSTQLTPSISLSSVAASLLCS